MDLEFDVLPIMVGIAVAAAVAPLATALGWRATGPLPRVARAVLVALAGYGAVALVALAVAWTMKAGLIVAFAAFFGLLPLALFLLVFLLRPDARP